jgi:hypothetical protein
MWAHLKTLKRSGRGHDPAGTKEGECAVLCPACPQPGMNLPDNWRDPSKDRHVGPFLLLRATFNSLLAGNTLCFLLWTPTSDSEGRRFPAN